jgi:hypothetical protein
MLRTPARRPASNRDTGSGSSSTAASGSPRQNTALRLSVAILLAQCLHCTEEIQIGRNTPHDTPVAASAGSSSLPSVVDFGVLEPPAPDAAPPPVPDATPGVCTPVDCGNFSAQCGNCRDDDGDGRIDADDPECLGPCDDSESGLSSGITTRVNGSCRADCYFDRNSGSGDDGCSWSFRCDPLALAPDFPPTGLDMCGYEASSPVCQMTASEQSACDAGCLPLTPNGCDCFGCCELPAGSQHFVWLGAESLGQGQCDPTATSGPSACPACTPVPSCQNDCAECELCVGKPELPDSCRTGGSVAVPLCPEGRTPCDPASSSDCGRSAYCITGCCVPLPR